MADEVAAEQQLLDRFGGERGRGPAAGFGGAEVALAFFDAGFDLEVVRPLDGLDHAEHGLFRTVERSGELTQRVAASAEQKQRKQTDKFVL